MARPGEQSRELGEVGLSSYKLFAASFQQSAWCSMRGTAAKSLPCLAWMFRNAGIPETVGFQVLFR
jgi:hypothetical protein